MRASLPLAQFDSNGDGQISLPELREAMKKLMGEQVTNREINEILQDADLNGDGLVDFEGEGKLSLLLLASASASASSLLSSSLLLSSRPRVCTDDVPMSLFNKDRMQRLRKVTHPASATTDLLLF